MKATVCDKCKRPITKEVTEVQVGEVTYELCWQCRDNLKRFVEAKPNLLGKFMK